MSAKTKIVVLRRKQLKLAGILCALLLCLLVLFLIGNLRSTENKTSYPADELADTSSTALYTPGIYTTELVLGGQTVDVEVILSENSIDSIQLVNLDESITTMYPLLQPTFDDIYSQILMTQSVENIMYSSDNKYTSLVLLEAIRNSVEKGSLF